MADTEAMMVRGGLCDKEVPETKYQKDLFILRRGEGEEGFGNGCSVEVLRLTDFKAAEFQEHKSRREKKSSL